MSLALVVGGSGGLGAAISARLAEDGHDIALTYHRHKDRAERSAETVRASGRAALVLPADAPGEAVARTARAGPLSALVYAAGPLIPLQHLSTIPPEKMAAQIMEDALVFYEFLHAALPHLRASRGAVIACRSAAEARFAPRDLLSTAPKAAIGAMMQALAKEEGRHGIRANSVAIGLIDAGQMRVLQEQGQIGPDYMEAAARATPLRRLGRAQDVAEAVAFLASPARAGFITGQTLAVDGGYSV